MMLDRWTIKDFASGEGLEAGAASGAGEGWIETRAPGDTYVALIEAGRIEHPYAARNEAKAAWVRDREWWWHTRVEIAPAQPGERIELVFDGLDTFADIYLDGAPLGQADNMFRAWRFDVTDHVRGGEAQDLAICFHPTAEMVGDQPLPAWQNFADRISASRRTLMRKAQFGWGWDWGPDLPTVGIWMPARIERHVGARIISTNFATLSIGDGAEVRVEVETSEPSAVEIELIDPAGKTVARGEGASATLHVPDAQLWWTADLGAQPLYTLIARLPNGAEHRRAVGIRTVAIDQSPDPEEPGATFFRFVLNGVPIFAKGVNWIPADSFVGAIEPEVYDDYMARVVQANMNMVRVWGGGLYEPDAFYDACDREGLLVWQDFMFACAPYPDDDAHFTENVRIEVQEQVRRVRGHACLALWCGNNENEALQWFDAQAGGSDAPLAGLCIYHELIPGELAALDPATPYWPGSPLGGPTPNSMCAGDVHNWTVWHGIPYVPDAEPIGQKRFDPEGLAFTRYAEDTSRFVSEFGIQGAPDMATLRRWMAAEDLASHDAPGFEERIKDEARKAHSLIRTFTGPAETIQDYLDFTAFTQAEGLKFGIEHFRRRKPHCSGALIWQYNDCWPCVSWSLIDYDGVAKAAYYSSARAFAPVLASFREHGDALELWITNDTLSPVSDVAKLGEQEVRFEVPANSSQPVWRGPRPDAIVTVRGAVFPANRWLPAPVKDIAFADPGLAMTVERSLTEARVTISAADYTLNVHLLSDDPDARFDDNYFDLMAGERRTIAVTHARGAEPPRVTLRCWNDRNLSIEEQNNALSHA